MSTPPTTGGANNRNNNNNYRRGGGRRQGGRGRGGRRNNNKKDRYNNNPKTGGFQGALKEGPLKGMIITDNSGNRVTQYEKLKEALPPFCANKGWNGLHEIVRTEIDWDEDTYYDTRPDANQWSRQVNSRIGVAEDGTPIMGNMIVITNPNLQEELLSAYERKRKLQEKKWDALQENKKALITIIRGQLDAGTKNELEVSTGYDTAVTNGDIITILKNLRAICYGNDDGGISLKAYKAVLAVKSLNNFTNQKPHDPHTFKDDLIAKYQATLSLTNRFPNGTVFMETLLSENLDDDGEPAPLTIEDYFGFDDDVKTAWEKKGDKLCQAMLFCANSKNEPMKKDLRLAYAHGNTKCYPYDPESFARLYHSQYRIYPKRNDTNPTTPHKSGGGNDDDTTNARNANESGDDTPTGTAGVHVEPNGPPGNDGVNNNGNEDADEEEEQNDRNNTQRTGGVGGVHLTSISGQNQTRNYTISELLGTHPINHPIFNTQCEDDSSDSEEALAGMYQFYADEDDSSNEESKHKINDGQKDVQNQMSGEETCDVNTIQNTNDNVSEINNKESYDNYNKEEFSKLNDDSDDEQSYYISKRCDDDSVDDESMYSDQQYDGDRLHLFRNDGDDYESLHDYLGENNYDLDESDEEYLDESTSSNDVDNLHEAMKLKKEKQHEAMKLKNKKEPEHHIKTSKPTTSKHKQKKNTMLLQWEETQEYTTTGQYAKNRSIVSAERYIKVSKRVLRQKHSWLNLRIITVESIILIRRKRYHGHQ